MVLIKVKEYIGCENASNGSYVYEYIFINENLKNCKSMVEQFKKDRVEQIKNKVTYEYRVLGEFLMYYHKGDKLIPHDIKPKLEKIAKEIVDENNNS